MAAIPENFDLWCVRGSYASSELGCAGLDLIRPYALHGVTAARRIPVASRKPPRRWRDRRETRREKRDESREKRDDRREKRGIRRKIEERSEIEERNQESREALEK